MNEIELTQLFVEYKKTKNLLAELEAKIQAEISALEESRSIAGVKATYYKPSIEYNYEAAARAANVQDEIIAQYSTITYTPRWKEIAEYSGANIDAFKSEKPARVGVK